MRYMKISEERGGRGEERGRREETGEVETGEVETEEMRERRR